MYSKSIRAGRTQRRSLGVNGLGTPKRSRGAVTRTAPEAKARNGIKLRGGEEGATQMV